AGKDYTRERTDRARAARGRLIEMLDRRAKENRKRYQKPQQAHKQELGRELDIISNRDNGHDSARVRGSVVAGQRDSEPLRRTGEATERASEAVRRPEAVMRRDRPESISLRGKGRISDNQRGLDSDRDRETASADAARSGRG